MWVVYVVVRRLLKNNFKFKKKQKRNKAGFKNQLQFREKLLGIDCDKRLFLQNRAVAKMLDELFFLTLNRLLDC